MLRREKVKFKCEKSTKNFLSEFPLFYFHIMPFSVTPCFIPPILIAAGISVVLYNNHC